VLQILPPLFIALLCHLLLFLIPLPQAVAPPQLPGKKGIEIHLQMQQNSPPARPAPVQPNLESPAATCKTPLPPSTTKIAEPTLIKKKILKKIFPVTLAPPAPPQQTEVKQNNSTSQPAVIRATPFYQKNPKPKYPALARRRNWQGTVILSISVSVEGKGKTIQIHRSSGYTILDKSALQTVNTWHFHPGTKDGKPVEMKVLVPVHFRLDS